MKQKSYMSISEFARLTGIKRPNLIFYDKIGLLSPEYRGKNEYRYYSRQQLGSAYLIVALRELDIGLDEIRQYAEGRTPERMIALFGEQEKRIRKEINRLKRMREVMRLYTGMAEEALLYETEDVRLQEKKSEPIFLGFPSVPGRTDDENMVSFYRVASERGLELGYPLGVAVTKETIEKANWDQVYQYYFKVSQGQNTYKPEGLYAVVYGRCGYGKADRMYKRLLQYIEEHQLRICGNAYEEYPLNEMAIQHEEEYCTRVEIMVEHI